MRRACALARAWTAAGLCALAALLATRGGPGAPAHTAACARARGTATGVTRRGAAVQRLWCTLGGALGWCAGFELGDPPGVHPGCRLQPDGAGGYDAVMGGVVRRGVLSAAQVAGAAHPPLCTRDAVFLFGDELLIVRPSLPDTRRLDVGPATAPVAGAHRVYWLADGSLCWAAAPTLQLPWWDCAPLPEGNWDAAATLLYWMPGGPTVSLGGALALDVTEAGTHVGYSAAVLPSAARAYREVATADTVTCRAHADGSAACHELRAGGRYVWGAGLAWVGDYAALPLAGGFRLPHRLWLGTRAAPVLVRAGRVAPLQLWGGEGPAVAVALVVRPRGACATRLASVRYTLGPVGVHEQLLAEHQCLPLSGRERLLWDGSADGVLRHVEGGWTCVHCGEDLWALRRALAAGDGACRDALLRTVDVRGTALLADARDATSVERLLAAGASPNAVDAWGAPVLLRALPAGRAVAAALLAAGAAVCTWPVSALPPWSERTRDGTPAGAARHLLVARRYGAPCQPGWWLLPEPPRRPECAGLTACPAGRYCPGWRGRTNGARPCPAGSYGPRPGAVSVAQCRPCPAERPHSAPGSTDAGECVAAAPAGSARVLAAAPRAGTLAFFWRVRYRY